MKQTKQMHTITDVEFDEHNARLANVLVRFADVRPNQKTMQLRIDEVAALIYNEQMQTEYWKTRR
jgi:hypothetical protein